MSFPENFLWGGATANAQYEGGFNEGGRGLSQLDFCECVGKNKGSTAFSHELTYERFLHNEKYQDEMNLPFRRGTDFYHRYKEDIALMAKLGAKTFRLSISWCRIFPTGEETQPNQEGLDFYHNVFRELHKYHIEPLVTMIHYEVPVALVEKYNGWESPKLVDLFVKYGKTLIDEYKDEVKYWITFNEINWTVVTPYSSAGVFTSRSKKNRLSAMHQALHHQLVASALLVKYCHKVSPSAKIGLMIGKFMIYPMTCKPEDVANAYKESRLNTFYYDVSVRGAYPKWLYKYYQDYAIDIDWYPDYEKILAGDSIDYIAIAYYSSNVVDASIDSAEEKDNLLVSPPNPHLMRTAWGSQIDPMGLTISLEQLYDQYQKPIFVVENGIGAFDTITQDHQVHDAYRIEFHREYVKAMQKAIDDGVELLGYTTWGIIDLVSASGGQMCKRYGFVYVDADDDGKGTYDRFPKDSFYWYQKCIATGGDDLS